MVEVLVLVEKVERDTAVGSFPADPTKNHAGLANVADPVHAPPTLVPSAHAAPCVHVVPLAHWKKASSLTSSSLGVVCRVMFTVPALLGLTMKQRLR